MSKPAAKRKGPTVVSVLNLKGGVGKTTVTAMLARDAARKNLNVLAVDLDPQANLSQVLMGERQYANFMGDESRPAGLSVVELFEGRRPPSEYQRVPTELQPSDVVISVASNLEIVPSRFDFAHNLIDESKPNEKALENFIRNKAQDKDLVLIDCAPTESILTWAAYRASGYVLIPVKPELFSTIGFPLMAESLAAFKQNNRSHAIEVCGVLINQNDYPSQYNPHAEAAESDIKAKARAYRWHIFSQRMTHSRGYPKMAAAAPLHWKDLSKNQWPPIAAEIFAAINL